MASPTANTAGRRRWKAALAAAIGAAVWMAVAMPASADDWQVDSGDERQTEIVDRYQSMLEENPSSQMALDRLLGHIGLGAGLDEMIGDYRERVEAAPEQANLRLVLGHLLEARGDYDEAIDEYERALELDADDSAGWVGRGTARLMRGDRRQAMEDFEEALEREDDAQRRRELMEELGELAFSQRDFERGMELFEGLIGEHPRDEYLRMAYVELLVQYRQVDAAIEQYDELRPLVSADPRSKANLLRDKADVYEMMGETDEAIALYEEIGDLVRADSWIARDVRSRIVDVYRQAGRLDEFIDDYAPSWRSGDFDQQMAVADVYAELGRLDEALDEYRRLTRQRPSDIESREKTIRTLERIGRESEIPSAYRDLIRTAPGDETYRFELAQFYIETGDRDGAQEVLDEIRGQFSEQSYVLLELAEHYARWQFQNRARQTYDRVLEREPDDDVVIIDVGDYYLDTGDRSRAVDIWETLPDSQLGESDGRRRLAEVFVERNLIQEGIDTYDELLDETPDDRRLLQSMARALERADRWEEALERWEQLLEIAESPRDQRDARARMIQIYDRLNALPARIRDWQEDFDGELDDGAVEAGFLLAQAHIRRGDYEEAETVLQRLDDSQEMTDGQQVAVYELLEQTYVRGGRYGDAVDILDRLAGIVSDQRAELWQRRSEHALEDGDDERAVEFATMAVEANPDSADAQRRLGDVYRQIGDREAAARHYRTAIDIDQRADDVQLSLGEVLVELGEVAEAEETLLDVVEDSSDDQLVRDAGELMLSLAADHGRLEALETRWVPLTFRMPLRRVHAELMFELYDRIAGPLLLEAYHGMADHRQRASEQLFELGGRAATLVVAQLRSDDVSTKARAVRMAAELDVDVAASQIGRLIERTEDEQLRHMAIVAAARLGQDDAVEPLAEVMGGNSSTTRALALWALGYIDSDSARQALRQRAVSDVPGTDRDLALIGLMEAPTGGDEWTWVVSQLDEIGQSPASLELRSATLLLMYAGQDMDGQQSGPLREALAQIAANVDGSIGIRAARTLGMRDDVEAAEKLWRLALSNDPSTARRGEEGLVQLLSDDDSQSRQWSREMRFFDWSDGSFDAERLIDYRVRNAQLLRSSDAASSWNETVETGLRQVVTDGGAQQLARWTVSDIRQRLTSHHQPVMWRGERIARIADVIVDDSAGELQSDVEAYLVTLRDGVEAARDGELDASDVLPIEALSAGLLSVDGGDERTEHIEEFVLNALSDDDSATRRTGLAVLMETASQPLSPALRDAVVGRLGDDALEVQTAAVQAVGHFQVDGADERLDDLEADARPILRRAIRQTRRVLDSQHGAQ